MVAAITTITADLFLTEPGEVEPYERLFTWMRKSALSQEESLDLITETAAGLQGEELRRARRNVPHGQ